MAEPQALAAPHDKPSFLRRHRWQIVGGVIAIGVLGALAVRVWLGAQVSTEPILRRDFVQPVVASGHVEAPHRVDVGAQVTGKVLRIPAAEGQSVKAGAVLIELEATELSAVGRQANVAVVQAQARLRQLQEVQAPVAAQTLRQAQVSLEVTVRDVYAAETVARHITEATGVEADSWIKTNAQFFTAVNAQTTSNTAIRFFVGLSVAFGIASVLAVVVVQKLREIGILRAMGISRGQILRLFLLKGGLLALGGAVLGCGIGALGLVLWQSLAKNAVGTPLFPLVMDPKLFAAALLLATLTGLVAAFAPARSAARLDPAVAIRG